MPSQEISSMKSHIEYTKILKLWKRYTYIPGFSERFSSSKMYNSEKHQLAFRRGNINCLSKNCIH